MLFQIINQVLNMEYVVNLNNIQHTSHHQYDPTEASVDPQHPPPPDPEYCDNVYMVELFYVDMSRYKNCTKSRALCIIH